MEGSRQAFQAFQGYWGMQGNSFDQSPAVPAVTLAWFSSVKAPVAPRFVLLLQHQAQLFMERGSPTWSPSSPAA